jgi:adenosine deaminase
VPAPADRNLANLAHLPKAHLHLHLEGSMRPATLAELAAAAGTKPSALGTAGTFAEFGRRYAQAATLVRDGGTQVLRRLVREVVEDAAADGAIWVEPQVNPLMYTPDVGAANDILDLIVDEGRATAERLGIGFGVMTTALRDRDPADAVALARLAARHAGDGVVAFGLAGDEAQHPPEPFTEAFALARDAGLIPAPHAGEHQGPDSVRAALDFLGARRIGHGVRALEDPELLARLAAEDVVLDVCPTSNALLGVVGSLPDHPLPRLLAAGVRCTLNADDPLLFGPGLLDEYENARTTLGLDDATLAALARTSVEASGAPRDLVQRALEDIDTWLRPAAPSYQPPVVEAASGA